jgi:hypothetical protein
VKITIGSVISYLSAVFHDQLMINANFEVKCRPTVQSLHNFLDNYLIALILVFIVMGHKSCEIFQLYVNR